MSPATWLSVALICALGAASPGPSLTLVVRHTLAGSRARGVACALAHALGVGVYALATVLGLAALVASQPQLYRAIATLGAVYLLWLALGLARGVLRDRGQGRREPGPEARGGVAAAIRDGFLMALLNPKIAVFFLALFSQFVGPEPGPGEVLLLAGTALVIDGLWYVLVASVLSGRRITAWSSRHGDALAAVMAALLAAAALWTLGRFWLV